MSVNIALVTAAGLGTRMGSEQESKLRLELNGKTVLQRSLEIFQQMEEISKIMLVVRAEDKEDIQKQISTWGIDKLYPLVEGGETRQKSVFNGLKALRELFPKVVHDGFEADDKEDEEPYVLIHDAARCFTQASNIRRCLDMAKSKGSAALAVPVKDTIKSVDDQGRIRKSLDRSSLWQIQTPQIFTLSLIYQAHSVADRSKVDATDDASLAERLGFNVYICHGSYDNIKITTPEDMHIASYILGEREELAHE